MTQLPPPYIFGLPNHFSEWRENQDTAVESILNTDKRFILQVCPTGFGKSLTYMTAAHLLEGRTIILTSTKGLQTQLVKDFGGMDTVEDIRGRGNYSCRLNTQRNCDFGLCVFGFKCDLREAGGCFYFDQLKQAKRSKVVITNYAYWMSQNEFSEGLGNFDLMVLDEAHSAPDHVISHVSVTFSKGFQVENKLLGLDGSLPNTVHDWVAWATDKLGDAERQLEYAKERRKEKQFIIVKRLVEKLKRLESRMDDTWVWEETNVDITLSPVWPMPFTEPLLFTGIPKVLFTSATAVPKTVSLLGVRDSDTHYEEYPHSFPLESRPLTHVKTVRMNHKTGEMENRLWLTRLDQIIRDRTDRKGIIHTVSYARRDMILERSKYRDLMVTHNSRDTEVVVRAFKNRPDACILVSPAMATGWDFPDDECRWQVIVKLPYPDTRGEIIKARMKQDKDFASYIVMQQLIQAVGRGVRNETDWCETFIIDDNIVWFLDRNQHLTVEWFRGAYRSQATVPPPIVPEAGER